MTDYHAKFNHDRYYHILNRGNNGENLFASKDNFTFFLKKWELFIQPYAGTLAYCLMPNHFHFLVKIVDEVGLDNSLTKPQRLSKAEGGHLDINLLLEDQFKRLFMSYANAYNKQQKRTGSLFQKRFKRIEIASDDYLTRIIHYIHHNTIHHGFVNDYKGWKFSSYNSILSHKPSLIKREDVLNWFGDKEAFIRFHKLNIENQAFNELKKLTF